MTKLIKTALSLLLISALTLGLAAPAVANDLPIISDWALEEANLAREEGLTADYSLEWSRNIDCLNATAMLVSFVGLITEGKTTDWSTGAFDEVLGSVMEKKAYDIGLIDSLDEDEFLRGDSLNRQEFFKLLYLSTEYIEKEMQVEILPKESEAPPHSDWNEVSKDAQKAVRAMVDMGLVKGTYPSALSPKTPISIEQAVVLLYRCFTLTETAIANA